MKICEKRLQSALKLSSTPATYAIGYRRGWKAALKETLKKMERLGIETDIYYWVKEELGKN